MGWIGSASPQRANAALRRGMAQLEGQVAALVRRTGLNPREIMPVSVCSPEVRRLVAAGDEVAAITLHRQETGRGLAEATADTDALRSSAP